MSTKGSVTAGIEKFPNTHIWVDSCAKSDLEYALSLGAVGATTNPVIVGKVLKQELPQWEDRIRALVEAGDGATEEDIAWQLIREMGLRSSGMLMPTFEKSGGRCGRVSMQTNIKNYRNTAKMVEQAVGFHALAENMQVKMPGSPEGVAAIEETTYRGVSVNATVVFSVCQAVAVAEAVERGLTRRREEGLPWEHMTPVCTIMIGRVDDWLKEAVKADNSSVRPEILEWAGVAVFKHAYEVFQKKGYTTRLLTAAYRNRYHWSEFLGGDVCMTITRDYIQSFDASGFVPEAAMDRPVDPAYLSELLELKEFRKAYDEDGMKPEEYIHYGPFVVCLKGFLAGYDDLLQLVRSFMLGKAAR